jgi:thymidylate synthase
MKTQPVKRKITIEPKSHVDSIRYSLATMYEHKHFIEDKSGCKTLEIIGASFPADEDSVLGTPNKDYIKRELEWYESQSLFVQDIPGDTPKIWKECASNLGVINSNYGYLIFSEDNVSQYQNVLQELGENPNSRRAIMIYTRPHIWLDYYVDGMSDLAWQKYVQEKLIDDLETDTGTRYGKGEILWHVGSFHLYERHFPLLEEWMKENWKPQVEWPEDTEWTEQDVEVGH